MLVKKVFGVGIDAVNAIEVALYIRLGERGFNFKEKPNGNNIFGNMDEGITFLKDQNNQVLNPAQKPAEAIKELLKVYTVPGDTVLDIFSGTGQVARAAVELGRNSVSIDQDPIQCGFLCEFLRNRSHKGVETVASYSTCNYCNKIIGEAEPVHTCKTCQKLVHQSCSTKSDDKEDTTTHFCSKICKDSVLD